MKKLLILPAFFLFACGDGEATTSNETPTSTSADASNETVAAQQSTKTANISAADFKQGLESQKAIVLDVRTPGEIAEGKIVGAVEININDADFLERLNQLDKSMPVYVYCKAGGRSSRAMKMMSENGFSEVNNLDGGITAWIAAGYPVSK